MLPMQRETVSLHEIFNQIERTCGPRGVVTVLINLTIDFKCKNSEISWTKEVMLLNKFCAEIRGQSEFGDRGKYSAVLPPSCVCGTPVWIVLEM
jgi:hypothetical protein